MNHERPRLPSFQTFGAALNWHRERSGYSRPDVATLMGVHPRAIDYWEDGASAPIKSHLDELLKMFPELREAPLPKGKDIPKPIGRGVGDSSALSDGDIEAVRVSQHDELIQRLLATLDARDARAKQEIAARDEEIAALKLKLEDKVRVRGHLRTVPDPDRVPPENFGITAIEASIAEVPPSLAGKSAQVRWAQLPALAKAQRGAPLWIGVLSAADELRYSLRDVLDAVAEY